MRQRFRLVLSLSFYALLVHGSAMHAFDRDRSNLQALARARALEIIDRELMGQASVVAYSRIYVLSATLILALIPLLLLVRHTRGAASAQHIME